MAGKEISEKESFYTPKGGTGYGVRTLVEFIQEIK
jgi:leucyl aminopeptidase